MTPSAPLRAALALVLAATAVAGCDVRLETPEPTAPEPGPVEVVRDGAAGRSADLARVAAAAAATAGGDAATVLTRVSAEAAAHLVALGGVYVPFPDALETAPEPEPVPAPGASGMVDLLLGAAAATRGDADTVADGPLARLLASIATARTLAVEDLAAALGEPDRATPTTVTLPQAVPSGTPGSVLEALVVSQDGLAYAWEVVAARSTAADREFAAARGAELRDRAAAWARATGLAEPGIDPRRVAYDLPDAVTVATGDAAADHAAARAALGALEAELAELFATAVAGTDPGARGPMLDGLLDSARLATDLGVPPAVFPGLPEQG